MEEQSGIRDTQAQVDDQQDQSDRSAVLAAKLEPRACEDDTAPCRVDWKSVCHTPGISTIGCRPRLAAAQARSALLGGIVLSVYHAHQLARRDSAGSGINDEVRLINKR